jgi:Uma2 family endonuclease
MRMQAHVRTLVSEAEFLALPESTDKIELLDGEVIVSPSPTFWHQEVLRRIVLSLGQWATQRGARVTIGQAPLDVRFQQGRILQPDAFVILDVVPRDQSGPLARVPEICIEVLSTDRVYDRVTKRMIYAQAGVQEYWVVEPAGLIERFSGPNLAQIEELRGHLTTPLLVGYDLDLDDLFRVTE